MECLKFELYSPCATFKTPFSLKGIETYPLPPYSTVIGLLYTALGRKWEGEEFSISVQGDYEAIFRDYIRFRKYNRKDKEIAVLPLEVPRLYNLRCVVHLLGEGEIIGDFVRALQKPKVYLFLGGGEYPVWIKSPRRVEVEEREVELETPYSAFVPESKYRLFDQTGVPFRLPSFYEEGEEKTYRWEQVYFLPKSSIVEGRLLVDREGDVVWV